MRKAKIIPQRKRSLEDMPYTDTDSYYKVTVIKIYGIFTGLANRAMEQKREARRRPPIPLRQHWHCRSVVEKY